jgi:hypothetical protein
MPKQKATKPGKRSVQISWLDDVAEHDYAAAQAYLSLTLGETGAARVVAGLRDVPLITRRANDILRAARLEPAPLDDPGVLKDLVKIVEGEHLSPVLVARNPVGTDIADGYHRVSLVYRVDPYGDVPLRLYDSAG